MKLDDLARIAGVSKTTASYVINGKAAQYRISEKTQAKVMAVVAQTGYVPDHGATSLRRGSSKTLGLVIPDLENQSYATLGKLLETKARAAGYQLMISCSNDDPQTEKGVVQHMLRRKLDGLIVASALTDGGGFYQQIQSQGVPVVAVDRQLNTEHFAAVCGGDEEGAFRLTQHLLRDQPRRVVLLGARQELKVSQLREQGFRQAAGESGEVVYGEEFTPETSIAIIEQWLANDCVPDVVVCSAFILCEGVLDALQRYPQLQKKLQVGTFGDHRFLDFLPFKVQSLPQSYESMAQLTLERLLQAMAGEVERGVVMVNRDAVKAR